MQYSNTSLNWLDATIATTLTLSRIATLLAVACVFLHLFSCEILSNCFSGTALKKYETLSFFDTWEYLCYSLHLHKRFSSVYSTCFDKDLQHSLQICLFAYWQFFSWMLYPFDKAKIALSCKKTSQLLDTLMVILAKAKSLSSIIQKLNRRGGATREEGADSRAAQAEPTKVTSFSFRPMLLSTIAWAHWINFYWKSTI